MSAETLRIARFRREDQAAVRALIIDGMAEHWGIVDPDLNPDLDDIATTYADGAVLVAWTGNELVGAGALVRRADAESEIKRMSVATPHRRRGVGHKLLAELVELAEQWGARRVVLETTATWHEAIAFYTAFGFQFSHDAHGTFGTDRYFFLDLPHRPDVDSNE